MNTYTESKKALDKIREDFCCKGDIIFRTAIQYVVEYGQQTFQDYDFVMNQMAEIDGKHDDAEANGKTLFISRNFEKAIIECDFSGGILDGTDDEDKHIRDACTLNRMRREYNLFNSQMGYLSSPQKKLLLEYLTREKSIEDLAEQEGIQYRSVQKKISEIKMIVKKATVNAMERGDL